MSKPADRLSVAVALITVATLLGLPAGTTVADDDPSAGNSGKVSEQRLLLLGQGPDGHPPGTHEYMAGVRLLAACLGDVPRLETEVVSADEPWTAGPAMIDRADGVVIFLSEGAKWIHQDPDRLAALERLAARGGAIVGIHWGIGTRKARYIDNYLKLVGGCHGGPDRRYKVVEARPRVVAPEHPVMRGVEPIALRDEFYYELKFVRPAGSVTPLLEVPVEGKRHAVAWAWDRPDGGRSFGFSGCHFHENWEHAAYRRMVSQGILWTLNRPVPESGFDVDVSEDVLALPPRTGGQK